MTGTAPIVRNKALRAVSLPILPPVPLNKVLTPSLIATTQYVTTLHLDAAEQEGLNQHSSVHTHVFDPELCSLSTSLPSIAAGWEHRVPPSPHAGEHLPSNHSSSALLFLHAPTKGTSLPAS